MPQIASPLALAALVLAACAPPAQEAARVAERQAGGYLPAPSVQRVTLADTGLRLSGAAPAGAEVRAQEPGGAAITGIADEKGAWSLTAPAAGGVRLLGLSARLGERRVQSQGYLLIAPNGVAALLRAGGGAHRLEPRSAPSLSAFDFDGEGGAILSGLAAPGTALSLRVDGRQSADATADAQGRFSIVLPRPIAPGTHRLGVVADAFQLTAPVQVSRPVAPEGQALRTEAVPGALRADWRTPGGGIQATLLFLEGAAP